ncbi:hypothetical protein ACFQU7_30155 [Pseudoroseomonas wenyumeiae]
MLACTQAEGTVQSRVRHHILETGDLAAGLCRVLQKIANAGEGLQIGAPVVWS